MKTKKLFALFLTLLLAFSCAVPTLAAQITEKVTVFDVRDLVLPAAGMTVKNSLADVYALDQNGTQLPLNSKCWWCVEKGDLTAMEETDTFEAGKTYLFNISLNKYAVSYDCNSDGDAIMTAYRDGQPWADADVYGGGPPVNACPTINWNYTVPAATEKVTVFDVRDLVLPKAGMTVKTSLADVYALDQNGTQLPLNSKEWSRVENGNFISLNETDTFEAGKTYLFNASLCKYEVNYDCDSDGDAIMTAYRDGQSWADAGVYGGGPPGNACPTINWRYTVPAAAEAPVLTVGPRDTYISVGGTASFTVSASGTDPSYQWYFFEKDVRFVPLKEGAIWDSGMEFTGVNTPTLHLSLLKEPIFAFGEVYCLITNSGGSVRTDTVHYYQSEYYTDQPPMVTTLLIKNLELPREGKTVADSLMASVADGMACITLENQDGEGINHIADYFTEKSSDEEMCLTDVFEGGKTYTLHITIDPSDLRFDTDKDGNPVFDTIIENDSTSIVNASGGSDWDDPIVLESDFFVPHILERFDVNGLKLPAAGLTVGESLAALSVEKQDVQSADWFKITDDGKYVEMKDTDTFVTGQTYHFSLTMDAGSQCFDTHSAPSSSSVDSNIWVDVDVYLDGLQTFVGETGETISAFVGLGNADLTYFTTPKYRENQFTFSFDYTPSGVVASSTTITDSTTSTDSTTFTDVPENAWYRDSVQRATDMGLVNGKSATSYCPEDNMTYAEAIKLAACMNQLYTDGKVTLTNGSPNWYSTYVAYCLEQKIIDQDYSDVINRKIDRQTYAAIFAKALPATALPVRNTIPDNAIPDVKKGNAFYDGIYTLYRAGILNGSKSDGTFNPTSNIKRSEVATILVRMMDKSCRVGAPADFN